MDKQQRLEAEMRVLARNRDRAYALHMRAVAHNDYAQETHQLALSNFANLLPWRWGRWWKTHREINRRLKLQRVEQAAIDKELG